MICIEEQSLLSFWGALRLHQIVNDMSFWATTILKPKISMYIDQWRLRHMHGFRVELFKDQLLFDTVQKVEERQKHIGLHRSSNLAEMVRMALIIQEVSSIDAEIRSKRDASTQTQEFIIPPNQFSTPAHQSSSEAANQSTKSSRTRRTSVTETPSRSGPTKITSTKKATEPAPDLESIVKPRPLAYEFQSTRDDTAAPSNHRKHKNKPRLSPSAFKKNIFKLSAVSTSEAASRVTTTSSVNITDTSDALGASIAVKNSRVTASTSSEKISLQGSLSKGFDVSAGGHVMKDKTDILSSQQESSEGENWSEERLSEMIDDIPLFKWSKKSS